MDRRHHCRARVSGDVLADHDAIALRILMTRIATFLALALILALPAHAGEAQIGRAGDYILD